MESRDTSALILTLRNGRAVIDRRRIYPGFGLIGVAFPARAERGLPCFGGKRDGLLGGFAGLACELSN